MQVTFAIDPRDAQQLNIARAMIDAAGAQPVSVAPAVTQTPAHAPVVEPAPASEAPKPAPKKPLPAKKPKPEPVVEPVVEETAGQKEVRLLAEEQGTLRPGSADQAYSKAYKFCLEGGGSAQEIAEIAGMTFKQVLDAKKRNTDADIATIWEAADRLNAFIEERCGASDDDAPSAED